MKRVLIFSLSYYPRFYGGAEIAVKEITDRIDPNDIEFHMATLRYDKSLPKVEQIGNVLVHRIGFTKANPTLEDLQKFPLKLNKYFFQFTAFFKTLMLYTKYRYDGVWAIMAHSSGIPAALFKTVVPNIRYVLTLQEGDPLDHIERLARPVWPLFVRAFTKADMVQAISTFLGKWAQVKGFKKDLEVVPNGVDIAHFTKDYPSSDIESIKKELQKKEGIVALITTSRLVHKNAIDDCIRAISLLPSHIHFYILGTGPEESKLRALASDLLVRERVHFLGQINYTMLPLYLRASDVFIRPSRSEGMGNSFIEAMAAGIPVIATQEGGISDFLFDAKRNQNKKPTGWAIGKDNPEQIVSAVQDILSHPEEVRAVTENAKQMVIEKYDWNLVARDMKEKVFDRVLNKK